MQEIKIPNRIILVGDRLSANEGTNELNAISNVCTGGLSANIFCLLGSFRNPYNKYKLPKARKIACTLYKVWTMEKSENINVVSLLDEITVFFV
jgi:hypothetical protein